MIKYISITSPETSRNFFGDGNTLNGKIEYKVLSRFFFSYIQMWNSVVSTQKIHYFQAAPYSTVSSVMCRQTAPMIPHIHRTKGTRTMQCSYVFIACNQHWLQKSKPQLVHLIYSKCSSLMELLNYAVWHFQWHINTRTKQTIITYIFFQLH